MKVTPLESQQGGAHYKEMVIQPVEFIYKNDIPYMEGNVIKYVCRWKKKNGIEDLHKAKHYLELLIQFETDKEEQGYGTNTRSKG